MTMLDLAKEWLRYAKSDFNTASHMYNDIYPKEIEISCYHSHQCAEKSLKAFLLSKYEEPPHTHDLVDLCRLCSAQESGFSNMQKHCIFLNPYGVQVRYPNELCVDDIITKNAIENAKKILEFCEKLII
jgi:HEPN domain-containing protein